MNSQLGLCSQRETEERALCVFLDPYLYVLVNASAHLYVCVSVFMYLCMCCEAPPTLPGASLIFTQLHYPWQMEYICVRLLHGERGTR